MYVSNASHCSVPMNSQGSHRIRNALCHSLYFMQVMYNLHVVFTMNPSSEGLKDRAATSPALFNRCVLNWFGDWSNDALYQVGKEFTYKMDLEKGNVSAVVAIYRVFTT